MVMRIFADWSGFGAISQSAQNGRGVPILSSWFFYNFWSGSSNFPFEKGTEKYNWGVDGLSKQDLDALETRLLERIEKTETTLLKEFRKWSIKHPATAMRMQSRIFI